MIVAITIFRYRFLSSHPIAYETVFQKIRDGVVILDHNNTIMDINSAAATGLGKSPGEIIRQNFEKAFEPWRDILGKYLSEPDLQDAIELDFADWERHILLSITPLERPDETLNERILTLRDITDRNQYQISLETLAFHDPLTRIANRRKFQEEFEIALEKSKISGEPTAVLYFDLNHFKAVNDTFGHETGDEFLKYVAARVASVLRKPDLPARLGSDKFAALLHNCDAAGLEIVLERMLENVQRPFKVGEHTLIADLSIGAAFYPADGNNMSELLHHADAEMYLAKQQKHNAVLP
ncbi:MAG: sensor domain-containing diguanylate cyclase [Verrucomicrobiota bacterium]|nr:sensor domain-containing diguanylate cyclase [Verrucomicrobiota bacterium]